MRFPTHIVSAGGIVEDGNGNILLVKAHDDGWVYPGGITEVGRLAVLTLSGQNKKKPAPAAGIRLFFFFPWLKRVMFHTLDERAINNGFISER